MRKPEIKFAVGDVIKHDKYGVGTIKKINENDFDFIYFARFEDKTKAWFNNRGVELVRKVN